MAAENLAYVRQAKLLILTNVTGVGWNKSSVFSPELLLTFPQEIYEGTFKALWLD